MVGKTFPRGVTGGNAANTGSDRTVLSGLNFADLSGWGAFGALVSVVLFYVLTGRLMSRTAYREMKADRDFYRAAGEVKTDTINQLVQQNGELRAVGRVQVATMQAITQQPAQPTPREEESP